jgi:peptidoglycan hydrolase-like protein with peptidoglycan-binding domain
VPTNITASVGKYGVNRSTDVKVIQGLLNLIPQLVGGPEVPLKIDGIVGPKTIGAITRFQNMRLGHADGRVDPHQQTLAQLDQLAPKDPKTQAEADKTQSIAWAMAAGTMLAYYDVLKLSPLPDPLGDKVLIQTALNTHFHLDKQPAFEHAFLSSIKYNYTQVLGALAQSATIFRSRTDAEAISDGAYKDGSIYPAYTFFNKSVNFTQGFLAFGPLCRAAMVLHEPIHYVDSLANNTNDFYEHSAAYANITPQQAIHNPSSYVAFAQHVFYRKDERYGAGRPNE